MAALETSTSLEDYSSVEMIQLTDTIRNPSAPTTDTARSASALYLNSATTVDAIENAEKRTAMSPATRAILSSPGKERNVTDALKTMAAFHKGS